MYNERFTFTQIIDLSPFYVLVIDVVCEEIKGQMTSLWESFKNGKIWEKEITVTVTKEKVIFIHYIAKENYNI